MLGLGGNGLGGSWMVCVMLCKGVQRKLRAMLFGVELLLSTMGHGISIDDVWNHLHCIGLVSDEWILIWM